MKTFYLFILIALGCLKSNGQATGNPYKVTYLVNYLLDTLEAKSNISYSLLLFLGNEFNVSISKNQFINDSISDLYKKVASENAGQFVFKSNSSSKRLTSYESAVIFYKKAQNVFLETNTIGLDRFVIRDDGNKIEWKLTDSVKQILGYNCQQATTYYKCRNWVVWFAKDIPSSFGPWKLHGLPGLILEAIDEKQQIHFIASDVLHSIAYPETDLQFDGYSNCTRDKFDELLKAYAADPVAYIRGQTGLDLTNNNGGSNVQKPRSLKLPNNPLENCRN